VRSSTRPYPYDEEPVDGLLEEDIDGDGRILFMRIPDKNGTWKPLPKEPRLLVRRDPTETGGKYYRVLPEGLLKNYDGVTIEVQSRKKTSILTEISRSFGNKKRTTRCRTLSCQRTGDEKFGRLYCQTSKHHRRRNLSYVQRGASTSV